MTPTNDQLALNLLPAFPAKKPLSAYRFSEYNTIVKNILETIIGQHGIKINKPGRDGLGWSITLDYSEGLPPWAAPKAWDITVAGDGGVFTATFSKCYFERDSFTVLPIAGGAEVSNLTFTMPAATAGDVYYLGFKYDSENKSAEIIGSEAAIDVRDTASPVTDVEFVKKPLYEVTFTTTWNTTFDFRNMPNVGLYGY